MALNSLGLLALTLPTNLEQPILTLQGRLFRELGLSSALALDPILPLLWSAAPLSLEQLRTVRRRERLNLRLSGGRPFLREQTVWLPVTVTVDGEGTVPRGANRPLTALRQAAREQTSSAHRRRPPFSDDVDAVRLCEIEDNEEAEKRLKEEPNREPWTLGAPEEGGPAPSSALTLTSLQLFWEGDGAWWRHCRSAVVATVGLGV